MTERRGFTLLEMLLVVAVLGITAGIALPNMQGGWQAFQLKKSVDDLVYLMSYAQSRAVIEGVEYRLKFDPDHLMFSLFKNSAGDPEKWARVTNRRGAAFHVPPDITVGTIDKPVDFYPDGTIGQAVINVCRGPQCYAVSTQEQRGYVQASQIR